MILSVCIILGLQTVSQPTKKEEVSINMDARAEFTKSIILETFLILLKEKPFNRITVTELVKKAGINRSTFYKHYLDIPDLLEQTETSLLEELRELIRGPWESIEELENTTATILTYIKQHGEKYIPLGTENGDPFLAAKTFGLLNEVAYPVLMTHLPEKSPKEQQLIFSYITQGCGGILIWWIQNGMKESPEYLAKIIVDLSQKLVGP